MTANKPSPFVPKLRFPEFRVDLPWLASQLADLYGFKRTNTLSRDKLNYETGTIKNIHYGDIHTKFKPLFRVRNEYVPYINPAASEIGFDDDSFCEEGDIILADASEDLDDVGKAIEVVSLDGESVVAGTHTILATRRGSVPIIGFGGQLFQSAAVRTRIKKEAQGAKVYGISANRISAVSLPIPPTVAEQQKIADCLGSLDDLIAAEGRKLEGLRQHKQGLMQQIFPRPGEARPRLRFPDFENAPEWETRPMGQLSTIVRGGSPRPIDGYLTSSPDGLSWLKIGDVEEGSKYVLRTEQKVRPEALSRTRVIRPGDFILSNSMSFGRPYISKIYTCIHDGWIAVTEIDADLDHEFLYYLIMSERSQVYFENQAAGGGVRNLTTGIVKALPLALCGQSEQSAIAGFLSSLDARIASEAERLDALNRHKQGLLQQLFPSLEDVPGGVFDGPV